MTTTVPDITSLPKTSIVDRVKKFRPSKKLIAITAGVALAGAALVFAVKRQDESDFDDEFATDFDNEASDDTVTEN